MTENYVPPKTISELLERYKKGERHFVECEFDDKAYDLRNLNLEGINLSKSFILADFRNANLKGINFYRANVKTCDFRDADLIGANFEDSAIDAALFKGAKLENSNFENAGAYGNSMKKGEIPDW